MGDRAVNDPLLVRDLGGPQVMMTAADRPDRQVAREMPARLRLTHPEVTVARADAAYAGPQG